MDDYGVVDEEFFYPRTMTPAYISRPLRVGDKVLRFCFSSLNNRFLWNEMSKLNVITNTNKYLNGKHYLLHFQIQFKVRRPNESQQWKVVEIMSLQSGKDILYIYMTSRVFKHF